MYFAIKTEDVRVITWLLWLVTLLVLWAGPLPSPSQRELSQEIPLVASLVICDEGQGRSYFPWQPSGRWRKWAWRRYQRLQQAYRRAVWATRLSKLVLSGAMSLAGLVDLITTAQLQRHLGALPVLYALFEVLQVRHIVNQHCPTAAEIDHGTVVLVLVLNRLMAPRPYVSADGDLPLAYQLWAGRTADKATVLKNMKRLTKLLKRHGWPVQETMLVGDRANLDDALAIAYDEHDLRYLAGLPTTKKAHRELLLAQPTDHFYDHPLTNGPKAEQCWGIACLVTFEHKERRVIHRGLVVLSNPMATALRKARATQLRTLRQELTILRAKIGQPRYRTPKALQRSVNARLKDSKVGHFMHVEVYTNENNQLDLRWQIDTYRLWQAMLKDGRYLLVTNDFRLSPTRMLALYRRKDGVEKRFRVTKSDLQVSPIYVHLDRRIESMLLVNMIALLAYSLLERQMCLSGLNLTSRCLIEKLNNLHLIETYYLDGSYQRRLTPIEPEQRLLLKTLAQALTDLNLTKSALPTLPVRQTERLAHPDPALAWPLIA